MSSEILDVLNIQAGDSGPAKKKQKTDASAARPKGLTGMSRELYQLLGQNTPPVAVRNQQKFKDRLNSLDKPSSWTWASFKNNAREDGLRLHHWVKGSKEVVENSDLPYKFEKYNVGLNIPDFTEEYYAENLAEFDETDAQVTPSSADTLPAFEVNKKKERKKSISVKSEEKKKEQEGEENDKKDEDSMDLSKDTEKPSENKEKSAEKETQDAQDEEEEETPAPPAPWDYEETRYLFDLAKAFDLRWVVIHDRYNFKDRHRTLEDLQERFYNVSQRILIYENEKDETSQNTNLIANLNFSKKKELDRKAYLNRLLERSPAEIAEEESLLIEAKKFEVAAKKTMTERAQLLQLLDSPQATGPISQYLTSQGLTQLYNQLMTDKRKRRVDSPAPENPLTVLNEKLKQQAIVRQKQIQQEKLEQQKKRRENPLTALFQKSLTPREEEAFGVKVHQERISPGVFLRSSKLPSYKPGVQQRIAGILNELGIGTKPVMSTERVVAKQDELNKAINTLLELKKQADKLESELRIMK